MQLARNSRPERLNL